MKATELIKQLQSQIQLVGDLEVEAVSAKGTHPIETTQATLYSIQIFIK